MSERSNAQAREWRFYLADMIEAAEKVVRYTAGMTHSAFLNDAASAETLEIADGLNVDLDAAGSVVGFDIDQASARLDPTTVETTALPLRSAGWLKTPRQANTPAELR